MSRRLLITLGLVFLPLGLGAKGWETRPILAGTDFAANFYLCETQKPGPRILILAPHSDEESAGIYLESLVNSKVPENGFVLACPWPVTPAKKARSRQVIEDLNRQFGPRQDNNTAIDILAHHVMRWINLYDIQLVFNLHEGWNQFRLDWNEYGQSVFVDLPELVPIAEKITRAVNKQIWEQKRFVTVQIPMPDTLTWYCARLGIPAFGVEIERGIALPTKLTYQGLILEEFFKHYGIRFLAKG